MKYFGIILFFLTVTCADADVYYLRDIFRKSSGTKNNYSEDSIRWQISHLLEFDVLYDEDIRINGADGELEAGLLRCTYFDLIHELDRFNSDNIIMTKTNTVIKFENVRYLIYNAGNNTPAICFAFRVPAARYMTALPFGLPDPGGGATYENVVEFPERKAAYVTFSNIDNAEDAFRNCAAQIRSDGFELFGGTRYEKTSGFFMTPDGGKIILMDFNEEHKNGFIYKRERKK